jgi:hypothetical protein
MKKLKLFLIMILIFSGCYLVIDAGYFNLDHLNKGKLMSIVISDNVCRIETCEGSNYPLTLTEKASMKEIESAIFMKPATNLFGQTKEGLRFHLKFVYQRGTVELDVGYDQAKGKIKDSANHRDYALSKQDIEVLSKYLIVKAK